MSQLFSKSGLYILGLPTIAMIKYSGVVSGNPDTIQGGGEGKFMQSQLSLPFNYF